MRGIRPGRVLEGSVIGIVLLMVCVVGGGWVDHNEAIRGWFDWDGKTCAWFVMIYGFSAAVLPVWLLLAPRDYLSTFLKLGVVFLLAGAIVALAPDVKMPYLTEFARTGMGPIFKGDLFPFVFITIACGAISGFHSLVAGGTTGKQLSHETHARKVGFNAMLLESALAVCVLLALGIGIAFTDYRAIVWPSDPGVKSNPILGFSLAAGGLFHQALGIPAALGTVFGILMVEGFVITTLDAAVRLNRYLFEELWSIVFARPPAFLRNYWVNAALSVVIMWVLAYSNAFSTLWPIFGTANQLLAALALLTVSSWLLLRGRRHLFTLLPALFMIATTLASLLILLPGYLRKGNVILAVTDVLLLVLAVAVVVLAARTFVRRPPARRLEVEGAPAS
jgi:carbon starvation protein